MSAADYSACRGGEIAARTLLIAVVAILLGITSASATCGSRGGPGYRLSNGHCASWANIRRHTRHWPAVTNGQEVAPPMITVVGTPSANSQGTQPTSKQDSSQTVVWVSVTAFVAFCFGVLTHRRAENKRRKREAELRGKQAEIERSETWHKRREAVIERLRFMRDAARRIATSIAKLPELGRRG
jgi:hypothetical protein